MSFFQQGYQKVEERQREIDEAMKGSLPSLIIKDTDEEVYISFVTAEPITYYEHFLPNLKRSFTCPDGGDTSKGTCPLCSMGNKAGFKGAYLVIDHRHEKWEKDGKNHERQHTLKIFKQGIRVLKTLQKLDAKLKKGSTVQPAISNGILAMPFDVSRSGKGTDTAYAFNPLNPNPDLFPRQYELEQGKTEIDTIVENIKPLTNEQLLSKINGGTSGGQQQQSYGQPASFGTPQGFGQQQPQSFGQQQPQGYFQNAQQQSSPGGGGFGAGVATGMVLADDDDVIDFGS
jgi:hypothetical protein